MVFVVPKHKQGDHRGLTPNAPAVGVRLRGSRKNGGHDKTILIGGDVIKKLNWGFGCRVATLVGTGDDWGKIALSPNQSGNLFRPSTKNSPSGIVSVGRCFEGVLDCPPATCEYKISGSTLIITVDPKYQHMIRTAQG